MDFWVDTLKDETNTTFISIGIRDDYNWLDNYETILAVLEQDCGCSIISGCTIVNDEYVINNRRIVLTKDGCEFDFYHDSFDGGYLRTQDDKVVPILEAVANELVVALKRRATIGKPF